MNVYPLKRGRWRLFNFLRRWIQGSVIEMDATGNRYVLNLDNHIDAHIYLTNGYESDEIVGFYKRIKSYGCRRFIDVGANIGCYTLFFSSVPEIKKVYAFEPDRANFAQLEANLWLNDRLDSVEAFPFALSDTNGKAEFQKIRRQRKLGELQYNSGTGSLTYEHPGRADQVEVQVRRFDELIPIRGERIAIKVDVEGHENCVLRGMEGCLRANECVLLIEATFDPYPLDTWLGKMGYNREPSHVGDNWLYLKATETRKLFGEFVNSPEQKGQSGGEANEAEESSG
ncbi:MAG: FkbM family methyltransferase [Pirellula sp.]